MSVETKVALASGVITFWSLGEFSDRQILKDGLTKLNLDKFAPEERAPTALLKASLEEVYGDSRTMIRPLASRNGFQVVKEQRGFDENKYEGQLTVVIDEDKSLRFSSSDEKTEKVLEEFGKQRDLVAANQLASSLVAICKSLTGITLRPGGAIYWLSGAQLDKWREIAKLIESASEKSSVYIIKHEVGDEAVKAVKDAITNDIAIASKKLQEDIFGGTLGVKALYTKKAAASALKNKVALYEGLLSTSLASLRATVEEVGNTADTAILAINAAMAQQGIV